MCVAGVRVACDASDPAQAVAQMSALLNSASPAEQSAFLALGNTVSHSTSTAQLHNVDIARYLASRPPSAISVIGWVRATPRRW